MTRNARSKKQVANNAFISFAFFALIGLIGLVAVFTYQLQTRSYSTQPAQAFGGILPQTRAPVFAYYYLWWSNQHWHDHLGTNYPYSTSPLPLPATLDNYGCNPAARYSGADIFDVSNPTLWDQDTPGTIEQDVRNAAAAGIAGFYANWAGDGTTTQTPTSNSYNRRLDELFAAVNRVNAQGIPFKLMISYKASANVLPLSYIQNDFAYFARQYGNNSALDHTFSSKPEVSWTGSWKYDTSTLSAIWNQYKNTFFLIADEKDTTWDGHAAYFEGATYYWSSQNPYTNPTSFTTLQNLAARVRQGRTLDGRPKLWFAPFIAGYDKQLSGGTNCVPRTKHTTEICPVDSTIIDTMKCVYKGNAQSNPDGWAFISWNEITEGTYIMPLTRWGNRYTNMMHDIIVGPSPTLPPTSCGADINRDHIVNLFDFNVMRSEWQRSCTPQDQFCADINHDGVVNDSDLSILKSQFGQTCP